MNDNLPIMELPAFATANGRLARSIRLAQDAVAARVGYDVEVARIEPIERNGHTSMRVYWRRKPPVLTLVR